MVKQDKKVDGVIEIDAKTPVLLTFSNGISVGFDTVTDLMTWVVLEAQREIEEANI